MTILQENTHEKLGKPPSFIFYLQFCSTITILRKISNMSSPFQPILKTLAILQVKQDLLIEKGQEKPSHHLPCSCRVAMEILTVVLCQGSLHWILTFRENCLVWQKGGSDFGYMATLIFSLTSTDSTFRLQSESFFQWLLFSA